VTKTQGLFRLDGKTAVVTGASRGIGRAIAEGYADAGARVALLSRKREGLEETAAAIRAAGGEALVVPAHVGKREDIDRAVDEVLRAYGSIDVLVNNAGANPAMGGLTTIEESVWDKVMDVNLKGPWMLSARVAREMIAAKRGGKIVNVSSNGGLNPNPVLSAYNVSKGALITMTKILARELGRQGICVNAIAPGLVETKFAAALFESEAIYKSAIAAAALGRHGVPTDIVGTALFLATAASDWMTGQVLVVDGGSWM
jgi:NAD(P)-dependent dehydrogenase (short-subunit alcohol dehydrogenase family)